MRILFAALLLLAIPPSVAEEEPDFYIVRREQVQRVIETIAAQAALIEELRAKLARGGCA